MTRVSLTKDQKERLIELCTYCFPEYYLISMHSGQHDSPCFWTKVDWEWTGIPSLIINWYELLSFHLVGRLQEKIAKHFGEDKIWERQPPYVANVYGVGWKEGIRWTLYAKFHFLYPKNTYKENPVDFLYSWYKKHKK